MSPFLGLQYEDFAELGMELRLVGLQSDRAP